MTQKIVIKASPKTGKAERVAEIDKAIEILKNLKKKAYSKDFGVFTDLSGGNVLVKVIHKESRNSSHTEKYNPVTTKATQFTSSGGAKRVAYYSKGIDQLSPEAVLISNEHRNLSHTKKYNLVKIKKTQLTLNQDTTLSAYFSKRLDQSAKDIDRAVLTLQSKPSKEVNDIYSQLAAYFIR